MKKLLLTLFFTSICCAEESLLTVLLMVKDEQHVMQQTLQPFLDAGIQSYVVLDTDSTDKTIEVTQQLFEQHNITDAHIIQQPFIDFSTSRNYLIDRAEQLIPESRFFIMVDAEWQMHNVAGLIHFCKQHINSQEDAFYLPIQTTSSDKEHTDFYHVTRLFKAHKNIRFTYPVHEEIFAQPKKFLPNDIFISWHPTQTGQEKSATRNKRDAEILLNYLKQHPNDYRTLYFLGQTFCNLGNYEQACHFYQQALQNTQAPDILARIHYRIALIQEHLNWDKAIHHYLTSFNLFPLKAEPLIRIAQHHYQNKEYNLCYFFALYASKMQYPEHVVTEKNLYTYTRHKLLALAAWHLKKFDESKQAADIALANKF